MGTAMYYAALLALLSVLSSLQPTLGYVALSPWKNGRSTFYGVGDGTKGGSVNDWVRVVGIALILPSFSAPKVLPCTARVPSPLVSSVDPSM